VSDTVLSSVLDNLYDQMIAVSFLAAEITADRLRTSDGPPLSDWGARTMLAVGARPVQDDESETNGAWSWAAMGVNGTLCDVDEVITVPCGIATLSGDADMRTARHTAIAVYTSAAAFIRGTTLAIPQVMWCLPQLNSLHQRQTGDGAEVFIDFSAIIQTRT